MVVKVMVESGFVSGAGLGKEGQGSPQSLKLVENRGRFGLGYKPTRDDRRRLAAEKKERGMARVQGRKPRFEKIPIGHISENFISVGWVTSEQIATTRANNGYIDQNWVLPCPPRFELGN